MSDVLGKQVAAPTAYSPDILVSIDRAVGREQLEWGGLSRLHGSDVWHLYELSWLNASGQAESHVGVLLIPATTPATVESKSLKLYLNSLNFHRFESCEDAVRTICHDVERVVGRAVTLTLISPVDIAQITREPSGMLLDDLPAASASRTTLQALPAQLRLSDECVEAHYMSHRLRSLCPVTGQPDWATLTIQLKGATLNAHRLSEYIDAYREHSGFHEQCVERIFADLWRAASPEHLQVAAFYTRRGGIDITPWRSTQELTAPLFRMGRQ